MADQFDPLGPEFVEVNTVLHPKSAARKQPAGGVLNRTGRLVLNMHGTDLVDAVARAAELPQTHYWTKFRVNRSAMTVAIQAVDGSGPRAVEVRRSPDKKNVTLYLHSVFAEFPELRPGGTCAVKLTMHPSGQAALINLASGGLSVRQTTRGGGDQAAGASQ